MGEKYTLLVTI